MDCSRLAVGRRLSIHGHPWLKCCKRPSLAAQSIQQGGTSGAPRQKQAPMYGGFVSCRPWRWSPTPRGSFNLERSAVAHTANRSTSTDSGPPAALNVERRRRGRRRSTRRERTPSGLTRQNIPFTSFPPGDAGQCPKRAHQQYNSIFTAGHCPNPLHVLQAARGKYSHPCWDHGKDVDDTSSDSLLVCLVGDANLHSSLVSLSRSNG